MDEEYNERLQQHEDLLRSLAAMLAAQHEMNRHQVAINTDVTRTLARIETLLGHMLHSGTNGADA